jgi:hypothetical protein
MFLGCEAFAVHMHSLHHHPHNITSYSYLTILNASTSAHTSTLPIDIPVYVSATAPDVPARSLLAERSRAAGGSRFCVTYHNAYRSTTSDGRSVKISTATATIIEYSDDT